MSQGSGPDDIPTVHVDRRREGTTPPEERERAEAPRRREDGGGGGGGGWGGGGGGGGLPPFMRGGGGSKSCTGTLGTLALLVVVALYYLFSGGGGGGNQPAEPPGQVEATLPPLPTRAPAAAAAQPTAARPAPTRAAAAAPSGQQPATAGGKTWTVMLYQDADDKILANDIYIDANEAERAGSDNSVHIVTQLDRYRANYRSADNWFGTRRFLITQDQALDRLASKMVADLGDANMGDPKTLVDFATWAMQTYPADKYALILSDHGMGWPGGWSDASTPQGGNPRIPLETKLGNLLYTNLLDQALGEIRQRAGIDKLELVGLDACLMSQLEVLTALEPHARYAVTSEETEPALGWAYTQFLTALRQNPSMSGRDLGQAIVQGYIQDDQRVVDDQARAEFVGRGSSLSLFGVPSADQVAQQLEENVTLAAIDLGAVPALNKAFNDAAFAMQKADQRGIAQARAYAQSYTNIFGSQLPPPYLDLGNFMQLVKRAAADGATNAAADGVLAAIQNAVIAEKHGTGKPGSTGISFYFPSSELYRNPYAGPASYTQIANRFASVSSWDDFMAYHYTRRPFEPSQTRVAVPQAGEAVRSPAAGQIQIGQISLSSKTAAPGQPVTLKARVSGQNIGYVKLMVGFYDQAANSINLTDADYLQSSDTREVAGVFYPVWPQTDFNLEFDWDPVVFAITDGKTSAVALFEPNVYGKTREEAEYTVDGTYTYADTGDKRMARLFFRGGVLRQVFGFAGDPTAGSPWEILPKPGDTFTIQETWLDLDAQGKVTKTATQEGQTLTFGDQPFRWKDLNAAAGEYVVGLIVEDLDGNQTPAYTRVTVR